MKLVDLNPFAPRDPKARVKYATILARELRIYRKKPLFWISLIVVLSCFLYLMTRLDLYGRVIMLPIIFGLAFMHDTIVSHFVNRLAEKE